jgi:hypothetical protein
MSTVSGHQPQTTSHTSSTTKLAGEQAGNTQLDREQGGEHTARQEDG